jgi:hypothetical protein
MHKIYYDEFNSHDLFNKSLLSSLPNWTLKSWRNKLSISLIMMNLLNAFAVYSEYNSGPKIIKNEFLRIAGEYFSIKK